MAEKIYYWIKLKTDFFNRKDIDFLLSQPNGAEYVVLYQMLCLNTANNSGRLESEIGEILVPYDAKKIVRDCKYFDIDTVNIAMTLYRKLGLIYEEQDKVLKISNYDEMIGSESKWAEKKRQYRENKLKELPLKEDNQVDIEKDIEEDIVLNNEDIEEDIVRQEIRDKSIEYRDIDIRDKNNKGSGGSMCTREEENIFDFYEHMTGKTINPSEYEVIATWEDNELTRYVIKQSALVRATSIKYIQAILSRYAKDGIKTVAEAEEDERKFQESKEKQKNQSSRPVYKSRAEREEEAKRDFLKRHGVDVDD